MKIFRKTAEYQKQAKIDELLKLAKEILNNEIREIKREISWENAKKIIENTQNCFV